MALKFISWNVNGLRAVAGKGFKEIFEQAENFKKYEQTDDEETGKTAPVISMYPQLEEEEGMMMAAEE